MNPIQRFQSPKGGSENVEAKKPARSPKDDSYKKVERETRSGKDRKEEVEEEGGNEGKAVSPFELARKNTSTRKNSDSESGSGSNADQEGVIAKPKAGVQSNKNRNLASGPANKGKEPTVFAAAKAPSSESRSIAENQKEMMTVGKENVDTEAAGAMEELSAVFAKGKTEAKPTNAPVKGKEGFKGEQADKKEPVEAPAQKTQEPVEEDASKIQKPVESFAPKIKEPVKKPRSSDESLISDKEALEAGAGSKIDRTKKDQSRDEGSGTKQNTSFQGVQPQLSPTGVDRGELKEAAPAKPIEEIITQIVDSITVMKKGDLTETTMTLKNPPILSGATITLSTLDQAKGEFNITFAGLTPGGKQFLDNQLSQNSLAEALTRKDITVHQVITTTQVQSTIQAEQGQPSKEDQQQREQQQQQQQREQEQGEEQ